jgi:flagellar basal-body rod protein FlgC
MDLAKAVRIAASGMDVQATRLRVIAENLSNQDTTGSTPGADAYRRKTISFTNRMDSELGAEKVQVRRIAASTGDLPLRYDPSHPAANAEGYVRVSNVSSFVEVMDMKEAQRSYSANLNVMEASRSMLTRVIEMLK